MLKIEGMSGIDGLNKLSEIDNPRKITLKANAIRLSNVLGLSDDEANTL